MGTKSHVLVVVLALVLMPMGTMGLPGPVATHQQPATSTAHGQSAAAADVSSPTVITSCTEIDESGQYVLGANLTAENRSQCIVINASDVTLDGNGHTIEGDRTAVSTVPLSGTPDQSEYREFDWDVPVRSNITVKNLHLTTEPHSRTSLKLGRVTDVTVSAVLTENRVGIEIQQASAVTVSDSHITGSEKGLVIWNSSQVMVDNNTMMMDGANPAISVDGGSTDIALTNNHIEDVKRGVSVDEVDGLRIEGNTFKDVSWTVILISSDAAAETIEIHWNNFLEVEPDHFEVDEAHGISSANDQVVNATHNYWGAADGPSSPDNADEPLRDPVTGELANGSGASVTPFFDECGVTNTADVRFDPWLTSPTNKTATS